MIVGRYLSRITTKRVGYTRSEFNTVVWTGGQYQSDEHIDVVGKVNPGAMMAVPPLLPAARKSHWRILQSPGPMTAHFAGCHDELPLLVPTQGAQMPRVTMVHTAAKAAPPQPHRETYLLRRQEPAA